MQMFFSLYCHKFIIGKAHLYEKVHFEVEFPNIRKKTNLNVSKF